MHSWLFYFHLRRQQWGSHGVTCADTDEVQSRSSSSTHGDGEWTTTVSLGAHSATCTTTSKTTSEDSSHFCSPVPHLLVADSLFLYENSFDFQTMKTRWSPHPLPGSEAWPRRAHGGCFSNGHATQ